MARSRKSVGSILTSLGQTYLLAFGSAKNPLHLKVLPRASALPFSSLVKKLLIEERMWAFIFEIVFTSVCLPVLQFIRLLEF